MSVHPGVREIIRRPKSEMMKNPAVAAAIGQQPAGPSFIVRGIADAEGMYRSGRRGAQIFLIGTFRDCVSFLSLRNRFLLWKKPSKLPGNVPRLSKMISTESTRTGRPQSISIVTGTLHGVVFGDKGEQIWKPTSGKIHDSEPEARADLDGPNPENFFDGCIHRWTDTPCPWW
ncbi:hypothetical protein PAPYR_11105 [Paratrimastix pyriformis]|uniref:Uncharacterized protein n=1 Tax=Paratrimastix pyriformis TaxID=342808 RepID=A0ABQ8UA79_9EUKA|nr:hypothetical protein PAPYR_11105 [Paratrimastix pyriformis]